MEFVFSIKTLIYMYDLSMTQVSSHSRRMLRQATRPTGAADLLTENVAVCRKVERQETLYADADLPAAFFGLIMKNGGRRDIKQLRRVSARQWWLESSRGLPIVLLFILLLSVGALLLRV